MNSPMAPVAQLEYRLIILSGPEQGATYKLVSPRVTIGRGTENDIVLSHDRKCSRHHAVIEYDRQQRTFKITTVSTKNSIKVEGQSTKQSILTGDTEITVGKTKIKFQVRQGHALTAHPGAAPTPPKPQGDPVAFGSKTPQTKAKKRRRRSSLKSNKSSLRFWIIAGGAIVALVLALSGQEESSKEKAPGLRTEEQIKADIELAKRLKEKAEERNRSRTQNRTLREAQSNYVSGFRDYEKGQYERAMQSFQACISLNPQHDLCQRYYKLSQLRFRELIHHHMILGTRYREQNQFRACAASFRNAMQMAKDRSSPVYKEAKANYQACTAFLEGRF